MQNKATVLSVVASTDGQNALFVSDGKPGTKWNVTKSELTTDQSVMVSLRNSGDVNRVEIQSDELSKKDIERLIEIYVTYDPMNPGEPSVTA